MLGPRFARVPVADGLSAGVGIASPLSSRGHPVFTRAHSPFVCSGDRSPRSAGRRIVEAVLLLTLFLALAAKPSAAAPAGLPARRPVLAVPLSAEPSRAILDGRVDARTGALRSRFGLNFPARGAPEETARQFLRSAAADLRLGAGDADLELTAVQLGLGTHHMRFRQTYRGLPVAGSEVVVSINDSRGAVTAVTSEYKPGLSLPSITPRYTPESAVRMALAYLAPTGPPAYGPFVELMVHSREGVHRLAYRVVVVLAEPRGDWEVLVDAVTGEVVSVRDRMCYLHGSGLVFNPDPITTSGSPYGTAGLTDAGDANSPQLAAERKRMPLFDITQVGANFRLSGPATTIFDFPGPDGAPLGDNPVAYQQTDPDGFDYTRDQLGFEAVMVYAHITNLQCWIQRLGFNNVNNEVDPADPHGLGGADNAFYSPTVDGFAFGQGGVDDAEDAEVITHEYGHAIQENQVPGWGAFLEGGAMGEGFGDYLGGSYGRWESAYLQDWFDHWDVAGANTGLRRLVSGKIYPDSLAYEVHRDGEIWSACLWQIHGVLGRVLTDQIVIQSHFYLTPGATFRDGALAILQADRDITGGANQGLIQGIFAGRGILQSLPVAVAAQGTNEERPAVSYDRHPGGGDSGRRLLTAWVDDAYGVPGLIDARRMHASGGFTDPEFFVGPISDPDIGFAPSQNPPDTSFMVVGATDFPNQDILGFRVDATSGAVSASTNISGNLANDVRPAIAAVDSRYLAVYLVDDGTGSPFVEGQRVNEDGVLVGGKIGFPAAPFPNLQSDPDVGGGFDAVAGAGQFLVAWWQYYPGVPPAPPVNYIKAARVTPGGAVLDAPPLDVAIDTPASNFFATPAVAFDGTDYLVVWTNQDNIAGLSTIRGRRVNAITGALGASFEIGPPQASRDPDVAFADDQYLVVWETSPPMPFEYDVLGRRFTPGLGFMDPLPLPIAATGLQERSPRVTQVGGQDFSSRGQSFWVVWSQSPAAVDAWDIFGTFVSESTLTTFPPPAPLTLAVGVTGPPNVAAPGGTTVSLLFIVTNGGTRKDGYRLTPLESAPWPLGADRQIVALDPATSGPVMVTVTIPPTATVGTSNVVQLLARSTSDSTVTGLDAVTVTSSGAVGVGFEVPLVFELGRGAPNPFSAGTRLDFTLARAGDARLEIFNASGRRVRTLQAGLLSPGRHTAAWNGRDDRGGRVGAGIYFARLTSGPEQASCRLVLLP